MPRRVLNWGWAGYLGTVGGTALITAVLAPFQERINSTTVALAFLLVVLFVALFRGSRPALLASVLGMFCFNFFFLPPLYTLTIEHPENWLGLIVFFTTALAVGQLSARAKQRAEEAESRKREVESLYAQLQAAFERESETEAIKRSERLKSALLDAVTHDLRTPLTAIKASITTLIDEARGQTDESQPVALDEESRFEMLEIIDQEADRLNHFTSDLIDLARIEAGELRLRRRWRAVDEIISTALMRAQSLTAHHRLEITSEKELPVVLVDANAVSEVVYTLIDNAAKYSTPGSTIFISAERGSDRMLTMAVEDEGIGIDRKLRERVFDKFFRATRNGNIGTNQPAGTGMGLAIAKGIVEAHEGKIWIESGRNGKGTRVVLTLPIGDGESPNDRKTLPGP